MWTGIQTAGTLNSEATHMTEQVVRFCATADNNRGYGETPQEALDELMGKLHDEPESPIIISRFNRGDAFFTDAQQQRLLELRQRLGELSETERSELENLIDQSLDATVARIQAVGVI